MRSRSGPEIRRTSCVRLVAADHARGAGALFDRISKVATWIRMQVHLLVHPLGHRVADQVMLEQRQRHDERQQPLAVVLD
jgi:hypothetical protein